MLLVVRYKVSLVSLMSHLHAAFATVVMYPDSKVHWAHMGPIWGRQDPDGLHVGPMNFAIWVFISMPN